MRHVMAFETLIAKLNGFRIQIKPRDVITPTCQGMQEAAGPAGRFKETLRRTRQKNVRTAEAYNNYIWLHVACHYGKILLRDVVPIFNNFNFR